MIKIEITTTWSKEPIKITCKTIASSVKNGMLHITVNRGMDNQLGYCNVTNIKVL